MLSDGAADGGESSGGFDGQHVDNSWGAAVNEAQPSVAKAAVNGGTHLVNGGVANKQVMFTLRVHYLAIIWGFISSVCH